jgi:hypothetical protein
MKDSNGILSFKPATSKVIGIVIAVYIILSALHECIDRCDDCFKFS